MDALPVVDSPEFAGLVGLALFAPYIFCLGIYAYHFYGRKVFSPMRGDGDRPTKKHAEDWQEALFRPEGITAVVGYMAMGLLISQVTSVDLVPPSVKNLSFTVRLHYVLCHFIVFDLLMWHIHYVQHRWRWLYYNTHAVHHTIHSPTMVVALTGYLPDTALLILMPLHATLFIVPGTFAEVFVFAAFSLFHLHCIHSEFHHPWDPFFRRIGLVDTTFHHGHHLKPITNLAHFFVGIDYVYGTYFDASGKVQAPHADGADAHVKRS